MVADPPPARTSAGAWLMAAPMLFVGLIALAFGLLVLMVRCGGQADGERIIATLQTDCAHASAPVLQARMVAMGLGEPEIEVAGVGVRLTATLPSTETDHQTIPRLLAKQGEVQLLSADGTVLATTAQITGAGVEIDNAGMPTTLVQIDAEAQRSVQAGLEAAPPVTVLMDGQSVAEFTRLPDLEDGHLELPSGEGITAARMRVAADRSILLSSGPLPCKATVRGVVLAH
jgi:hypothetical protein